MHSLINKITFKQQKGINSLSEMNTTHNQFVFSDFPPSDTVKCKNVGPTFSNFRRFLLYLSEAKPVFVTSSVRFRKVRQLSLDFQLILSPSLDFQVALNLGETASLNLRTTMCCTRQPSEIISSLRNICN